MRRLRLVALLVPAALVVLLINSHESHSQPPGGGRPGGSGGDRSGGFRGFGSMDPAALDKMAEDSFNRYSQGGKTMRIADSRFPDRMAAWAKEKGITGDTLTREQYTEYFRVAMSSMGGGPRPGGDSSGTTPTTTPSTTSGSGSGDSGSSRRSWGWDRQPSDNDAAEFFRRSDRDQDGYLSPDEMSETLQAEKDKWDTNKDGQIDLSEYKEYLKAFYEKRQQDRKEREQQAEKERSKDSGTLTPGTGEDPPPVDLDKKIAVLRAGKLGDKMPSWFTQHDLDKDAQIPLYEWKESSGAISEFKEKDLNADGIITAEEAMRFEGLARGTASASSSSGGSDRRLAFAGSSGAGSGGESRGNPGGMLGNLLSRMGGSRGGDPRTSGGSSGDPRSRMGMGMFGNRGSMDMNNPDTYFDMLAKGRSTFAATDSQRHGAALSEFLQKEGVKDGQVTRELFKKYWAQRPSDSGTSGGDPRSRMGSGQGGPGGDPRSRGRSGRGR